ncbi:BTAD domain-containing putative transcriptional regulator [Streptomyces sp. DH37]|uniref:AfsR/SARP family transcriptional regulator n=1 Tax=Streptomyces sp. DH37 TaxID=3040122 RepID=UPI0024417D80|nr:BTAD domain-containing putative transcriptional regulator [Streptomyces sp. DH37]MDG9701491.1 BTAD domain-containing putative transcriptional regulator [Streptomyces sp. DH37]
MTSSYVLTSRQPGSEAPHGAAEWEAHLALLGRFSMEIRSRKVVLSPSVQRLLALLALHPEGATRALVASTFWPDLPVRRAGASLRSTLWRLTRSSGRNRLVDADDDCLALAPTVCVDLHLAERHAAALVSSHASGPAPLPAPAELSEDLLPDWTEDWLMVAREHFRQTRLHALEAVARRLRDGGELAAAMECAMTAVEAEPLRESAHRHVVDVHLAEGNVAEALRHYEFFRRMIRSQLGLGPSSGFRRLVAPYLGRPLDP